MTRFLGTPRVAAAFYFVCSLTVLGWVGGEVHWWLALPVLSFIGTVRKAGQDVRRYDQWFAAWQGMGNPAGEVTPKRVVRRRKSSSSWVNITVGALSLVIIPLFIAAPGADEATRHWLALLWFGIAAYLLFKLAISFRRARLNRRAGTVSVGEGKTSGAVDIVEWMLPPASSSPSRADAMRNVPDYCARLMGMQ
ncbi:MAG: hypothetical protein ABSD98_14360 [Candidatus Korobacteraceae bacterium]|jgi:hypothetical protein